MDAFILFGIMALTILSVASTGPERGKSCVMYMYAFNTIYVHTIKTLPDPIGK